MNFLAHLFLSFENDDLIIGNFIADFIKNKEVKNYTPAVQKGIILHRKIDSFTDNNPFVKKGISRLQPFHHKYAPVVIDILYDYLLANNWSRYTNQSLGAFAQRIYITLKERIDDMPPKLKMKVPKMINGNWLESYKTKEGLLFTLQKMDKRAAFPSNFTKAIGHLEAQYNHFDEEFNNFFPQLIRHLQNP